MPNSVENPKPQKGFIRFIKEVGDFLISISLPWFIGLCCWYFISTKFHIYEENFIIFYGAFVLIVSLISLLTSAFIRKVIEWIDIPVNRPAKKLESNGKRLIRIILTGIILPIALSVAANLIPVSGGQTLLTILLNRMKYGTEYSFISKIGDTTVASGLSTKLQGVNTLCIIHSTRTLDELFRIFIEDHQFLNDYDFYDSLSTSIASYPESRTRLLEMFFKSDEFKSKTPRGIKPDLYNRFFSQAFINLRDDLDTNIPDSRMRDVQKNTIDEVEIKLKSILLDVENQKYIPDGGDPTLDFVLDTFYKMKIEKEDKEIYYLGRNVAVDPTYAIGTRVRAINLWAKLGNKNDLDQIILLLDNDDEKIRKTALKAIATIHMDNQKKGSENKQNNEAQCEGSYISLD